jgi:hypothetical protein
MKIMTPNASRLTTSPMVVLTKARMAPTKLDTNHAPPNNNPPRTRAPVTPSGLFQNCFGFISDIEKIPPFPINKNKPKNIQNYGFSS